MRKARRLKLYLVWRQDTIGYDEYEGFVCAAQSESDARYMHPGNPDSIKWSGAESRWTNKYGKKVLRSVLDTWVSPDKLLVTEIGTALKGMTPDVIAASFKAG